MSLLTDLAPGGWGFVPGHPLIMYFGTVEEALPELPLLNVLRGSQRSGVIFEAMLEFPRVREVRPFHLVAKYGMPMTSARKLVDRLRRFRG